MTDDPLCGKGPTINDVARLAGVSKKTVSRIITRVPTVGAWTIHLPVALGRTLGVLELIAASVMILALPFRHYARAGTLAAGWITLNHAIAAVFHIVHAEWQTLPQSAVMITLCLVLVALYWRRARTA